MNKIYIYNGAEFTEEQVLNAANALGLSLDDYINKYDLKIKDDILGKQKTTEPGASVVSPKAPESLDLTLTPTISESPKLEIPDTVKTGTTADTIAVTEEEQEASKNIISTLTGRAARGVIDFVGNWQSIPENLIYAGIAAGNDLTPDEKIALKDGLANQFASISPYASKNFRNAVKILDPLVKKYEDKDIYTALDNGNYTDAAEMIVGGAIESAPSIIASMLGPGAIAAFGAGLASKKFDEELRANPKQTLDKLAYNSILTGANEAAGEILTRKLLIATKVIKATGAVDQAKQFFEKGLKQFFKKYAVNPVGEGVSESLTEIANGVIDNLTLDKEITWPELRNQLVEAFTVGAFMGGTVSSITDAYTEPMSAQIAEQVLMPSQTQFELRNRIQKFSALTYDLQNTNNPEELAALNDMIAEEEQAIIDIKNQNKSRLYSLRGKNLDEYSRNRSEIYKLGDINNKKETTPLVRQRNTEKIKQLNTRNDQILENSIDEAYEQQITSVQNYARSLDYPSPIEARTQEQFDEIIDKRKNEKKVRLGTQGVYFPSTNEIIINKAATIESLNINAPAHEMLHAVLNKTILDGEPNAAALAESVWELLQEKMKDENFSDTEFAQRLQMYAQQLKYGKKNLDQEVLTLFNDALVGGDIVLSESKLSELGSMMRRAFYSFGFKRKFNTAQDVLNFLTDYNNSIRKGYVDKSIVRIAKEGATGRMITNDDIVDTQVTEQLSQSRDQLINDNKKLLEQAGSFENIKKDAEAYQRYQDNIRKIKNLNQGIDVKPIEGVSTGSIERSQLTQKIYEEKGLAGLFEIAKTNDPFINTVVNELFKTYPGFKETTLSKADFKSTLLVGTDRRPSNSLLGLIKSYKPDQGQTLSQYIMANLKNRGKGILDELIGGQVTEGAIDIDETVDIAAEEELRQAPFKARRRATSFNIPSDIIDNIYKGVKKDINTATLPVYTSKAFNNLLEQRFRARFKALFKEKILPVDGRPRQKDRKYTEFIQKNIKEIYNLFTVQRVRQSVTGELREFMFDKGNIRPFEQVRERLLEYFISPRKVGKLDAQGVFTPLSPEERAVAPKSSQLKNQHRTALAEQMSEVLGFEATTDMLETDEDIIRTFEQVQGLHLLSTELEYDKSELINNVVRTINYRLARTNISNILDNLDSATRNRVRKISRIARKLMGSNEKMSIIDLHKMLIKEFELDFIAAGNIIETHHNLTKYAKLSDDVDREKLKELYDAAYDATNLKVAYKKGNEQTYNQFEEFYKETKDIQEDEELMSMSRKEIVEGLNMHGILPDNHKKMSKGELEDFFWNQSFDAMKKKLADQKQNRTELEKQFNKILEQSTGVSSDKIFTRAEAVNYYKWYDKIRNFSVIPPNAEDFVGLLYKTLAKGKTGEKQFEFYKNVLINPYVDAVSAQDKFKNGILLKHKLLLKTLPRYKRKGLKSAMTNVTEYFNETLEGTVVSRVNAVRLYLWRQNGTLTVPGDVDADGKKLGDKANISDINVKQLNDIIKAVKADKELLKYAETIKTYTKRIGPDGNQTGYTKYDPNWLGGNVGIDLLDFANGEKRTEFLQEWQNNVDQIFNEPSMNKLQALYGINYVNALKSILRRMKTGRNRSANSDPDGSRWLDFINGSIGNIMFLNGRSAALQLISTMNYINMSDNNIFLAGKAFANQKQYWKDVVMLLKSDYVTARMGGLKFDIAASDLAQESASKNGLWRAFTKMGKIGFLPTQIMDAAAIGLGGATLYRNKFNRYIQEGYNEKINEYLRQKIEAKEAKKKADEDLKTIEKEAHEKAMRDWIELSNTSQQSSDPSKISRVQSDTITGRLIYSFANTSMQYTRIIKKRTLDFFNGRGNAIQNLSTIAYFGFAQGLIFNFLQNLVTPWWDEEEDDPNKKDNYKRAWNGVIDGHLRGIGNAGIAAYTLRSVYNEYKKQEEKGKRDPEAIGLTSLAFMPPLQSKAKGLVQAYRLFTYKQELEKMEKLGYKLTPEQIMNPRWMAYSLGIQSFTSIPTARLMRKSQNLYLAAGDDVETMDRILLIAGWDRWTLDLIENEKKTGFHNKFKKKFNSNFKKKFK